jgi:hypothetical protein
MHSAWSESRDCVYILAREEVSHVINRGQAELRGDRVGPRTDGITDRSQPRAFNVIAAQQIGVTLGDAPASEQAKSDYQKLPSLPSSRSGFSRPSWPVYREKCGANQGIWAAGRAG